MWLANLLPTAEAEEVLSPVLSPVGSTGGEEFAAAAAPFASSESALLKAPLGEGRGRPPGGEKPNPSCPDSGSGSGWGSSTGDEDDREGSTQSMLLGERETGVELELWETGVALELWATLVAPSIGRPLISMSRGSLCWRVRRACLWWWCWLSRRLKKEAKSRREDRWGETGVELAAAVAAEERLGEEVEEEGELGLLFHQRMASRQGEDHGRVAANV